MKVILELQDQPSNVRRVTVRHDIVIGRGSDCNLRLSAPQVSRRHCFLRVGREGVSVTDLDSSNGTYVDGKRIKSGKRYELTGGSALAIGPIKFVVQIKEEVVSAEILKSIAFSESGTSDPGRRGSGPSSSTAGTIDLDDFSDMGLPMNLAVEQGGASADSHEPTEAMRDEAGLQPELFVRGSRSRPELDSRAEIIDLGRRIAELDAEAAAGNASADTLRTAATDQRARQVATVDQDLVLADPDLLEVVDDDAERHVADDLVQGAVEIDEYDVIEVFNDPELLLDDSNVDEVVSVGDAGRREPPVAVDSEDVVEAVDELEEIAEADVEVISDGDSGSNWFQGPSQNETDIDPDLQKFLKGL